MPSSSLSARATATATATATLPVIVSAAAAAGAAFALFFYSRKQQRRHERSKYILQDQQKDETLKGEENEESDTLPSIIARFQEFQLDQNATIEEANKRRTSVYYEKAREAHLYDLVPGVRSYPRLRNRREAEISRVMKYARKRIPKSHRTVVAMCDHDTQIMLQQARLDILEPLHWTTDETSSKGVWIPALNFIPQEHLHVTVASIWWWHTIRENNRQLTEETAARFRQALVMEVHHAFQIELERIILLGGKTLVALWRCIGERTTADRTTIYDRHGEETDPFVKLRRDIVKSFIQPQEDLRKEPLTYAHRSKMENYNTTPSKTDNNSKSSPLPKRGIKRQNSIELKTPGMNTGDGFIHTTLARLPLDCLGMKDVELDPIHRLCREATATYCGHRMVVSKFRFLETTGKGGESNPCVEPIFDETIDAPIRVQSHNGEVKEIYDLHSSKNVDNHATIGALPSVTSFGGLAGLFDAVKDNNDNDDDETPFKRRHRGSMDETKINTNKTLPNPNKLHRRSKTTLV